MFWMPDTRSTAGPGGNDEHINSSEEGEECEIDGLASVSGMVPWRREMMLIRTSEIRSVNVGSSSGPRAFPSPAFIAIEKTEGQPRTNEGANEPQTSGEACRCKQRWIGAQYIEQPFHNRLDKPWQCRGPSNDDGSGGRKSMWLSGSPEDSSQQLELLLPVQVLSADRPEESEQPGPN
jgi:hypothetical protein